MPSPTYGTCSHGCLGSAQRRPATIFDPCFPIVGPSNNAHTRPFSGAGFTPALCVTRSARRLPHICRVPPCSQEIPNRFVKHGFRSENSYLSWESLSTGRRSLKPFERSAPSYERLMRRKSRLGRTPKAARNESYRSRDSNPMSMQSQFISANTGISCLGAGENHIGCCDRF
jgi:hypothetical protein